MSLIGDEPLRGLSRGAEAGTARRQAEQAVERGAGLVEDDQPAPPVVSELPECVVDRCLGRDGGQVEPDVAERRLVVRSGGRDVATLDSAPKKIAVHDE